MLLQYLRPVLLLIPVLLWYFYSRLRWLRFEKYKGLPMPPPSLIWGHLDIMGKAMKAAGVFTEKNSHPHYAFELIHKQIGSPGVLFLDLWPIAYPFCQIWSHSLAEQISTPSKNFKYSVDKSSTLHEFDDLIGKDSMVLKNGEEWKVLRKRFNPGFAPQHIITFLPRIISETRRFLARLDELCLSREEFEMSELATALTFDIIGAVVMDVDFNAQNSTEKIRHPVFSAFRELMPYFGFRGYHAKLTPWYLFRLYQRKIKSKKFNDAVKTIVCQKFNELRNSNVDKCDSKYDEKGKSILSLSLRGIRNLTPEIEEQTSAQIRSFLFAGHDTTSIMLQWALYSLYLNPSVLAKVKVELDAVLGPETTPANTVSIILDRGEEALSQLTYLSAVVKETLRLYPPAGSVRMAMPGSGQTLLLEDGSEVCIDGTMIWLVHHGIQRDPKVFGPDAGEFRPERWLGHTDSPAATEAGEDSEPRKTTLSGTEQIPQSAWRAFGRGPRNCIGQELAKLEAKVVLASVIRGYEFEKVGMGRLENGKLVGGEMYSKCIVTARPCDNMRMRVRSFSESS